MIVRTPGSQTLATHVFDPESPDLDPDAVCAVKSALVREFVAHCAVDADTPPGADADTPPGADEDWVSVGNDIVLAPG
jgi:hypothetical protein